MPFDRDRSFQTLALFLLVPLLLGPFLLSGCSRNEAVAEVLPDPATVSALIVDPGSSEALFQFQVAAPTGNPQQITVEYSNNLGNTFQPATLVETNSSTYTVPSDGFYSLTWNAALNLGGTSQGDLVLRLSVVDAEDGRGGTGATSGSFSIGTPAPPQAVDIETPQGPTGGAIAFDLTLADANNDHVTVNIDYSLDSGLNWSQATIDGSNSPFILPAPPTATVYTLNWNAQIDRPGEISPLARLRATISDANSASVALTSIFSVNLVAPLISSPTAGEIPEEMNGSIPYTGSTGNDVPFRLLIPTHGATISIPWEQQSGGSAINPASLFVTSTRTIGSWAAGVNLAPLFTIASDGANASWSIPEGLPLPMGEIAFEARLEDQNGNTATSTPNTFQVIIGNSLLNPFDWNDKWWLEFTGDRTSTTSSGTSSITVTSTIGANGIPDHIEDLEVAGLHSFNPLAASSAQGVVARVQEWVEASIIARLEALYGADSSAGGFAPALSFSGTSSNHTSALRIGGDDSISGFTLGRAMIDHRNAVPNNNRSSNLGVFTTNILQFYINSYSFRQRFQPLLPGLGTPVGEHLLDATVLAVGFNRSDPSNSASENLRFDQVWSGIDAWSRIVSVVAAHEIGHSIGLCSNGAPPAGLFGGVTSAAFAGPYTTPYHIDTAGLNLMSSALGLSGALVSGPEGYHFNELNCCYLREWTLLDD